MCLYEKEFKVILLFYQLKDFFVIIVFKLIKGFKAVLLFNQLKDFFVIIAF